jgi:hypothetical protein
MKFTIQGITCNACKKILEMELHEAGFPKATVSVEEKSIEIPDEYENNLEEIASVIYRAGDYELLR